MILVDTSVLIAFFRGASTAAAERLAQLDADEVPFSIPLICYQELLQGARDEREWKTLEAHLSTQRLLAAEPALGHHREAARIFFDCRRKGVTVRGTVDCLIAAQALHAKATLLHDDEDFERIATVRALKTLRA